MRPIHPSNTLHIPLIQLINDLQRLEITLNPLLINTLRNNRSPPLDPPRNRNLGTRNTMFLRHLLNNLMFHQSMDVFSGIVDIVLVAQGRIGGDFYAVLFMEFEEG